MKKFLLVLLALLFCFSVAFGEGKKEVEKEKPPKIGLSVKIVSNTWEALFEKSFIWYCEDRGYDYITNQAQGDPALQVTQSQQMIRAGIDGLIVAAQDADAAKPIVDMANEENIPVFTTDADINHPDVKMYIGFSGVRAGRILGEKLAEYLKNEVEPIGKVQGVVLEMRGPLGGASATDRSEGFHDIIDKYDGVEVLQALGKYQETPAKREAEAMLRRQPEIDAIYSGNGPMCVGAIEAMKDLGLDPTKIYVATIDAMPAVIDRIKKDEIDICLDQPCPFYNPIAVHYLVRYLEEGEAALPEVGQTITADEIELSTGVKHMGIDVWAADEAWAPAQIVEGIAGHLWFQTSAVQVTEKNADAGYLWANVKLPGW
ncbi:MAG: sugar ABC transporter substrate-binding protein [Spirochaetota bacterium]